MPRLRSVVHSGVTEDLSLAEARWVRTINVVTLACLIVDTGFIMYYLALSHGELRPVILTNVLWLVGYASALWINARGHPRRAVWLLLLTVWANTSIPAIVLGTDTGVYLYLALVPMIGVLISGPNDRLMRVVVVVVGVLAFAIVPVVFEDTPEVLGPAVERTLFVASALGVCLFGALFAVYYRWLVDRAESGLEEANARSERLLLNILPASVAERLKAEESPIADRIDDVTILFADLVGSTPLAEELSPDELVALLDRIFTRFDELADIHGLEKIASIGDGYVAAAGLPEPRPDHMEAAAEMALAMRAALQQHQLPGYGPLGMRFGLSSGSVVAGVIGRRKFRYDVWGDTVNTASRMESHGEAGMIHVTEDIHRALAPHYVFEPRGRISVKGKGELTTYFLIERRVTEIIDVRPLEQMRRR